ncbi:uncharacterized protein RHO25_007844 [Cercospora beticola]|uniref:Uncharacterized protein n=1 Tax=Cercospora beticola TaxID=122368 RepID=A0ABZ0NUB8_CERBT|nr:hypothetical protein RHO25_007844 [Cercospora beticola]CAK1358072.1 unnamed protein product [Cercospora beticola]
MDEVSSSLRDHLETLPQELYDKIYDFTFTAEEKVVYIFHCDDRPPHLLQVDRRSRQKFTASYYSSTTFLFTGAGTFGLWVDALGHVPSTAFRSLYLRTPVPMDPSLCANMLGSFIERFQEVEGTLRICDPDDTEFEELMSRAGHAAGQS